MSLRIPQPNNFDHLRLFFACNVACAHIAILSNAPALAWMHHSFNPKLAVDGFFIASGCLVTASYERSSSIREYFSKRIRRIYPGYATVILASLILGACITSSPHYWQTWETWKYMAANLVFLNFIEQSLPGVFDRNPLNAVNGALWTIKIEVMFYLLLPFLIMLQRKIGTARALGAVYLLSLLYYYAVAPSSAELARQLPGQLRYFAAGMALYYYGDAIRKQALLWLAPALLITATYSFDFWIEPLEALYPAALCIVVAAAVWRLPNLGNLMRVGDISYGVYILHFPIIQFTVKMHWLNRYPSLVGMPLILASVLAVATALWHFVEKPALRADSHYRQKEAA